LRLRRGSGAPPRSGPGLQRAVAEGALREELVAEVAQPVPVGGAHQLAALQSHARRRRHADANVDGLAVDVLQRAVVALAEEAQEQVDDLGWKP
jgi:hypothetical protein